MSLVAWSWLRLNAPEQHVRRNLPPSIASHPLLRRSMSNSWQSLSGVTTSRTPGLFAFSLVASWIASGHHARFLIVTSLCFRRPSHLSVRTSMSPSSLCTSGLDRNQQGALMWRPSALRNCPTADPISRYVRLRWQRLSIFLCTANFLVVSESVSHEVCR